jgi:hypothetical protein
MTYSLDAGTIVIRDGVREVWRGRPDGLPVEAVSLIEGTSDAIVLLDYMSGPKNFANLLRIDWHGTVRWRAEPPDPSGPDSYVELRWEGGELVANSWSGYRVHVDLNTGRATGRQFTK